MITWPNKDPDEILLYGFEWATELEAGDTIATSTWIVPASITKVSDGKNGSVTVVKLSGGIEGADIQVTNRITTTVTTETMDQSAKFKIKSR